MSVPEPLANWCVLGAAIAMYVPFSLSQTKPKPVLQPNRLAPRICVPLLLPLPLTRLNQAETENLPVLASADATSSALTPIALNSLLRTPPPTLPASAFAATDDDPAETTGPSATAFASESPPWTTTAYRDQTSAGTLSPLAAPTK